MQKTLGIGITCLAFVALLGVSGVFAEDALPARVPGTVQLVGDPDGLPEYSVVNAFPKLTFERPMVVACPGDGSGRLFVAEQAGVLKVFDNKPGASKASVALDMRKQVSRVHNEEGLLGLAFHPNFKKNKYVYMAYSTETPRQTVVARFLASGTRRHIVKGSEALVLRQRQPTGTHNGGCLAFGPDGYLYISLGDGGEPGDEHGHAQNLSSWLGSILRIDVNQGERLVVPDDNPFQGVQHVRPEIFAYGFADVRRFSFDPVTGDLWAGDAGAGKFEEINRVTAGGNYGWNLFEGNERFKSGRTLTPIEAPVLALSSAEARRVIGGAVYRGKRLPGLSGAYVYADHETGSLYALRHDGTQVKDKKRIGTVPGVTSVSVDGSGELLITSLDGCIYTLQPFEGNPDVIPFPQRLSETGLFTDVKTATPHPSLVPYTVSTPLWSSASSKERYVMLPGLEKVTVNKDGTYTFPVGTIFVKHFYFGDDLATARMLETRLWVHRADGWTGYTYSWKGDRSDAFLLDGRVEATILHGDGPKKWTYPSRQDCTSCHTSVAGDVLGFRREQLNVPMTYAGVTMNQLEALEKMGVMDGKSSRKDTWPDWYSDGVLDQQVRAYLDSNCAMCHQPAGPGNANIDLRYDTPLKKTNVIDRRPGMWNLGVFDARLIAPGQPERSILYLRMKRTDLKAMPTIGHHVPDEQALARIETWIRKMKK